MKNYLNNKEIEINSSTIDNIDINSKNNDKNNILFATQIYCLRKNNTDNKIEELISSLEKYKTEVHQMMKFGKQIPHYKFRKAIFKQIQLNLFQISEMNNKENREESINKLYKWYKNKMNFYFTLLRMNKRSYIKKDEQFDMSKYSFKKENEENSDNDLKHRTIITYKKIHYYIDEFRKHQLRYKKGIKDGNKSVEIRPKKDNSMRNILFKNKDIKKHFTKKIDKKSLDKNNFDIAIPKYEIKSSYSIERPNYNKVSLQIEKKINDLKNKYLMEKRNQVEIKKFVENFGKSRAMFKSDLNKNIEIKNFIKEFKALQEYKNLDFDNSENKKDNIDFIYNMDIHKNKVIENKKMNMRRINKINLNNIKNISSNNLLITSVYNINKTNDDNRNIKTLRKKIYINNKEEIDDSTKSKDEDNKDNNINKEEKTINIYCEFPKLKSNSALLLAKKDENDSLIKNITIDPVFSSKRYISKLCAINEQKKNEKIKNNISLSNIKYMSSTNIHDINNCDNNNNRFNYTKKNISESNDKNYLKIKKRFDVFKKEDYLKLKTFIYKNHHYDTLNKTALYNAFIDPKFNIIYPNYYLPRNNGYNLLLTRQKIDKK